MIWARTRRFTQVLEGIKKRGKSWQEIERLWEEIGDFLFTDPYKMETMIQERRCKTPDTFWPLENCTLNGGFISYN